MEEYFCTNCDAVLNNQNGFDPYGGTWTCTVCGQLLVDEDTFNGDKYEGVAWFCDECGAFLNKQNGFNDYNDSFICTNCYHTNRINESEIYKSKDEYLNSKYLDRNQNSGAENNEEENENSDVENDEEEDDNETDNHASKYVNVNAATLEQLYDNYTIIPSKGSIFFKRMKAKLFNKKCISIEASSSDMVGKNVDYVQARLFNNGFKNIKIIPVKDIYIHTNKTVGEVGQVVINGNSQFEKNDSIQYDAEIVISFHVKREIEFPFSPKDIRNRDYIEIVKQLNDLGFTQIYIKENADLITGWIKKDKSIERVTVKNDETYKKGTKYDYDIDIKIDYHTFPKGKRH